MGDFLARSPIYCIKKIKMENSISRRDFIKTSLQIAGVLALHSTPLNSIAGIPQKKVNKDGIHIVKKALSFYHVHTKEKLVIEHAYGKVVPANIEELNYFLRDFRTGEVHDIDPELLDILFAIKSKSRSKGRIEIFSGYRSKKTNDLLRTYNRRVAKKSLHTKGKALDICISDLRPNKLRDLAVSLHKGGVGYYGRFNFVHLDTGKVRTW